MLRSSVSRGHSGSSWETAGDGRASDRRRRYSAIAGGRRSCQGRRETPRRGKGRRSKTDARRPRQIQRASASARARVVRRGTTPVMRNGAVLAASQSKCKRARPPAPRPQALGPQALGPHAPRPTGRRRRMRSRGDAEQGATKGLWCCGERWPSSRPLGTEPRRAKAGGQPRSRPVLHQQRLRRQCRGAENCRGKSSPRSYNPPHT